MSLEQRIHELRRELCVVKTQRERKDLIEVLEHMIQTARQKGLQV